MLIAYDVALDLVRALRPVVAELRTYSADAADQVERAASSIVLNLAEGDAPPWPRSAALLRHGARQRRRDPRRARSGRCLGLADRECRRRAHCSIASSASCGASPAAAARGIPRSPATPIDRAISSSSSAWLPPRAALDELRKWHQGQALRCEQRGVEPEHDRPCIGETRRTLGSDPHERARWLESPAAFVRREALGKQRGSGSVVDRVGFARVRQRGPEPIPCAVRQVALAVLPPSYPRTGVHCLDAFCDRHRAASRRKSASTTDRRGRGSGMPGRASSKDRIERFDRTWCRNSMDDARAGQPCILARW